MPLMLEEDYQISLPSMHRVRQKFDRPRVEDPEGRIRSEFICTTVNYSDGKISLLKKISVRKGNTRKILDRKLSRLLISL